MIATTSGDMTQNYRGYWYDASSGLFSIAGGVATGGAEEDAETADWLSWEGSWGDEQYKVGQDGQYCLLSVTRPARPSVWILFHSCVMMLTVS